MFIFFILLNTLHHQPFCSSPILLSFQCNFRLFAPYIHFLTYYDSLYVSDLSSH